MWSCLMEETEPCFRDPSLRGDTAQPQGALIWGKTQPRLREPQSEGRYSPALRDPQSEGRHSPASGSPSLRGDTAQPQGAPVWGEIQSCPQGAPVRGEMQPSLREPQSEERHSPASGSPSLKERGVLPACITKEELLRCLTLTTSEVSEQDTRESRVCGQGWRCLVGRAHRLAFRGPAQHRPSIPQEGQLSVTLWVRRTQAEVEIRAGNKVKWPSVGTK